MASAPLLVVLLVLLCRLAAASVCSPSVTLPSGAQLLGTCQEDAEQPYRAFKGIPFAEQPVGELRFAATVPAPPMTGVFNASEFGPGCSQLGHNMNVPDNQSEACLFLNVFTPFGSTPTSGLPVMIWFYGGTFFEGAGSLPLYTGAGIVNCGLSNGTAGVANCPLLVTPNYRLGALGFLVFGDEDDIQLEGNYGFLDQQAAMKWVQQNIRAFGGDPSRVTIAGESAGAMSVALHLASPSSQGLFSQAIMESNVAGYRYRTQAAAAAQGVIFSQYLGCDSVACMRSVSVASILQATSYTAGDPIQFLFTNGEYALDGFVEWSPSLTGPGTDLLPLEPIEAFWSGAVNSSIPILIGTNANESAAFLMGPGTNIYVAEYVLAIDLLFGKENSTRIRSQPPYANSKNPASSGMMPMCRWLTDYWFSCPSAFLLDAVAVHNANIWLYEFDHIMSFDPWPSGLQQCTQYVCHMAELGFVFDFSWNFTFTAGEQFLAAAIGGYWTNFISTGNPNLGPAPIGQFFEWPSYAKSGGQRIVFNDTLSVAEPFAYCPLWNAMGYNR